MNPKLLLGFNASAEHVDPETSQESIGNNANSHNHSEHDGQSARSSNRPSNNSGGENTKVDLLVITLDTTMNSWNH